MGTDSGIEIKVVAPPKRGDNVVHPEGSSNPLDSERRRRRRERAERLDMIDFRPFERWKPWLVPGFVFVNVVLFAVVMYINNCPKESGNCIGKFLGRFSFQPMKENPLLGPAPPALQKMGALTVSKVVEHHQLWRLISCIWLHAGVFHLLANMLSLIFIGIRLEQEFGFVKIGFLYVISGFGGSLLSSLFIQSVISVGASGALFGLLGSMLSELIINWTIYANKLAALLTLLLITLLNLALGLLPHVDNFAHIGGFVSGFFLGFLFLIRPQFGYISKRKIPAGYSIPSSKPRHKPYQYALWIVSLILLIVGYTLGIIFLLRGVDLNDYCSWCHYMSCIPTKLWSCKSRKPMSCKSFQLGNNLNLTCTLNGKSNNYTLIDDNLSKIKELCIQLCN